jgi:hypothetical protein
LSESRLELPLIIAILATTLSFVISPVSGRYYLISVFGC